MNGRSVGVAACALVLGVLLGVGASAETALAPGDVLDVEVFGEQALSQQVTVAPDGTIELPLIGQVAVGGDSTVQAQDAVAKALAKYLKHPLVAVSLHTEAQYNVLVLGNVKTPGRYSLSPGAKLSDALAAAGGLSPDITGVLPPARVTNGSQEQSVSLEKLLRDGDLSQNVALANGSAVYVQGPAQIHVRVLGAVDHPGEIEISQGDRLAVAIAKAGDSPNTHADLNHIRVTHQMPDGSLQNTEVNLYQVLEQGKLSADVPLHQDDIVYVPEAKKNTQGGAGILSLLRSIFIPY
jgi:polysaccharide biosynthesis/export protein